MGSRLAALYVASVAIVTALHAATGLPAAASLALTPDRLARGELWELVTSAFLVAGPPVSQLLVLAVLAAVVIRRHGARTFWTVAIVAHVGSTLATYAGVGLLSLAHMRAVEPLLDQADYGISCVWAGALGAVLVDELAAGGRTRRVAVALAAAALLSMLSAFSSGLALPEHVLAFLIGAALVRRSARPLEEVAHVADRLDPRRVLLPQLRA
jgi:membrane associated rhomboid family serine protease